MDDINQSLNNRKVNFLNDVEDKIQIYIESTGKNCVAVVEKFPKGTILRTWYCDFDHEFCKVLYKFMRQKQYNGHDLDSALTEPISNLVETAYQDFYNRESNAISSGMLMMLAADEAKLIGFVERLTDIALAKFSKEVKKQVVDMVVEQIKASVEQGTLHGVSHQIGHVAATTAGTQVATIVAHLLIKLLAANIGHVVAKLLASAFVKKLITILVKKLVLAAVTTAVLQFLALHVGIALGGTTIMCFVLPLLGIYLLRQIVTFPKKLGFEVSKSVRKELDERFESVNKSILKKVFETVFEGNELVEMIINDEEFQDKMRKLRAKVQSSKNPISIEKKDEPVDVTVVVIKTD